MAMRRLLPLALALPLLSSLVGCEKQEEAPPPKPPVVVVTPIVSRDVPIYREWVGTIAGEVNATISAQVTGYLISRDYQEGSFVKKDQVLFRIDPAPFQATLDNAKGQLAEAAARKGKTEQDIARYTPLAATGAVSKKELEDAIQADKAAAAQIDSANAAIESAKLNLAFTTIRSPIDGMAGLAKGQVGDLVGPSFGPLTTVIQVNPARAYFSISQQLVTEIAARFAQEGRSMEGRQGPELQLILAGGYVYPEKGKLRFSANQVDVQTGTVQLVGEFPNPNRILTPGMFARVKALLDTQKGALLVPQKAITEMQGRYLIALVGQDNKVKIVPVEVGERVGEMWVISGKIAAGDKVVAEGVQKVREGATVEPMSEEQAKAAAEKTAAVKPAAAADSEKGDH